MSDRIDDWRTFVAVATHRSFVRASRELGRSPQSVTRAVAQLEERLGTKLFHRTTRSVSLTSAGARLVERSRAVLEQVEALERPADHRAPLAGTLSVTAPVLFGQMRVLPIVTEMLAAHAQLVVRALFVDRVVSLADEGVDVAVRIGALPDSSLRARRVGSVRSVIVASPTYLKGAGVPRAQQDLRRHSCIAFAGTTPVADRWTVAGRSVAVRCRLAVNSGQAALDAALRGVGLVRMLSYQVDALVRAKRLRVVFTEEEQPVHLVQLPGIQSASAQEFVSRAIAALTP